MSQTKAERALQLIKPPKSVPTLYVLSSEPFFRKSAFSDFADLSSDSPVIISIFIVSNFEHRNPAHKIQCSNVG